MNMDLVNLITKHKNWVLNSAVIIFALFIGNGIRKIQAKNITLLTENKNDAIKKNETLGRIDQLQKIINSYKNIVNKKDVSLAINTLGNIAQDASINIVSLKPQGEHAYADYVTYPFRLLIEAANYHAIGKFISKLENSGDIYTVDSISISKRDTGKGNKLSAEVQLSTVLIKD